MDTLLILQDTVLVDIVKVIDSCQSYVHETETSWQDVAIVLCICVTLIIIVTLGVCRFFSNLEKERNHKKEREVQQRIWEIEDIKRKNDEEYIKRNWQYEDIERKRQDDFLNKYLEFLKELTQEGEDEVKSTQYRLVLEYIIELSQKGELKTMSKENLESFFNIQKEKHNSQ